MGWEGANENSNSRGARPVHLIITMMKWTRTSRLSTNNSLSARRAAPGARDEKKGLQQVLSGITVVQPGDCTSLFRVHLSSPTFASHVSVSPPALRLGSQAFRSERRGARTMRGIRSPARMVPVAIRRPPGKIRRWWPCFGKEPSPLTHLRRRNLTARTNLCGQQRLTATRKARRGHAT